MNKMLEPVNYFGKVKMTNLEKILEEFDEKFDHYNPIHDDGIKIPIWCGNDYETLKSFISKVYNQAYEEGINESTPQYKKDIQDAYAKGRQEAIEECIDVVTKQRSIK